MKKISESNYSRHFKKCGNNQDLYKKMLFCLNCGELFYKDIPHLCQKILQVEDITPSMMQKLLNKIEQAYKKWWIK